MNRTRRTIVTILRRPLISKWVVVCLAALSCGAGVRAAAPETADTSRVLAMLEKYNELWETPSKNQQGSMPIGNGEIGLNVWVEENGDLLFYIARTDSWSGNGRILKLGRVRVALAPNPFTTGTPFRQELRLKDGEIVISAGAEGEQVRLRVWVDANRPVISVEADGDQAFKANVGLEVWRTVRRELGAGGTKELGRGERNSARAIPARQSVMAEPDIVLPAENSTIRWYHRNPKSVYADVLKLQNMGDFVGKHPDPLLNRTFGGLIQADGLTTRDDKTLTTKEPVRQFHARIYTLTAQTDTAEGWLDRLVKLVEEADKASPMEARKAHQKWWNEYWQRSWFFASGDKDAEDVTRAYILQRWINACGGRGSYPIKFNGAIFTVGNNDPKSKGSVHAPDLYDADYRLWGGCYWWQNTRFPYWAMLGSGDYGQMEALWNTYVGMVPLLTDRTRSYFDHDGVYYGETIYFWGPYANADFGGSKQRDGSKTVYANSSYMKYYFQSGVELSAMMLDYFIQTQDEAFVQDRLLPVVDNVVTFFDQHYPRDEKGKIRIAPSTSLETYRSEVENPLPDVVGLRVVLSRLLDIPTSLTSEEQRRRWTRMLAEMPTVPLKETDGKKYISPAEKYLDKRGNVERPEFYTLFPYRYHGVGQPGLDVAMNTWNLSPGCAARAGCWHQDLAQSACLGLRDEAKKFVVGMSRAKDRSSRFTAFWGAGHDWLPDQCHGGNLMIGIHRMLMQWDDRGKIYLLPAWPREWDVEFKLHASVRGIVEGSYTGGKLTTHVTPEARRKDVVVCLTREQQ
jgi:alpha-L-fucosidase 2